MIRRPHEDGWLLIRQTEHAKLSADLARAWRPALPDATVHLIEHHDDGWAEWEEAPQTGGGIPLNFTELDAPSHVAIWERGIARLKDPYHKLLVSRHACHLMSHKPGTEAFFSLQAHHQRAWARDIPASSLQSMQTDFTLLQLFDWLSLLLAWKEEPVDEVAGMTIRPTSHGAWFDPFPFGDVPLTVSTSGRWIPVAHYDSHDLQAALAQAPIVQLEWELSAKR